MRETTRTIKDELALPAEPVEGPFVRLLREREIRELIFGEIHRFDEHLQAKGRSKMSQRWIPKTREGAV